MNVPIPFYDLKVFIFAHIDFKHPVIFVSTFSETTSIAELDLGDDFLVDFVEFLAIRLV